MMFLDRSQKAIERDASNEKARQNLRTFQLLDSSKTRGLDAFKVRSYVFSCMH